MAGLEVFIESLRQAGFMLVLLWLLTLSVVYGILSHVNIPKSKTVQGVIAIAVSFLVLLAAAAGPAAVFVSNLVTAGIVIVFGLILVVIFFEFLGLERPKVFGAHPKFFGLALIVLLILIFIGAGGLGILNIPSIQITTPIVAVLFFLIVMAVAVWVLMKETGKGG
jgi:hypothetical protein